MTAVPREVPVQDVIALGVPSGMNPEEPANRDRVVAYLTRVAQVSIVRQYKVRPTALLLDEIDWLITNDADEATQFQPAHDCAACIAGTDQAVAFLREHPDGYLALANLSYTEVWP